MSNEKVYKTSEAERAYSKAYREANKEKIKAHKKAEYEANREAILASKKVYYQANKEKLKAKKKAYREANKEKVRARNKAYDEANKEKVRARKKAYREANREKIKAKKKVYYQANREKILEQKRATRDSRNARVRSKYISDIPYRLFQTVKHASKRALGRWAKKQEAIDLLGCTFEEYKEYLESKFKPGMSWENHSIQGWHIDHILPLNESKVSQEEKLQRLHYTNTQPLWAEENISKGNNTVYNPED